MINAGSVTVSDVVLRSSIKLVDWNRAQSEGTDEFVAAIVEHTLDINTTGDGLEGCAYCGTLSVLEGWVQGKTRLCADLVA